MRSYKKRYPVDYYSKSHKIYYLSFDNIPFYIGLTKMPLIKRRCDSINDCRSNNSKVNKFIANALYKENKVLEINLIEIVADENKALFYEEYWIHQFKQWGFLLLNQYKVKPAKKMQTRDCGRYIKAGLIPHIYDQYGTSTRLERQKPFISGENTGEVFLYICNKSNNMATKKSKRGGYRPGAGAKKTGRNTTCISFSVHKDFAEPLKELVYAKIKELKAARDGTPLPKDFVPFQEKRDLIKKIAAKPIRKAPPVSDYLKSRRSKKLGLK